MVPVTWSPFFNTTLSAHAELTARQKSEDRNTVLIRMENMGNSFFKE
jgi:hypothetical protein